MSASKNSLRSPQQTISKKMGRAFKTPHTHFQLPVCPENAFLAPSTPLTPMLGVPLLSKCISGCGTTSHPNLHYPQLFKMHFLGYQPLKPHF